MEQKCGWSRSVNGVEVWMDGVELWMEQKCGWSITRSVDGVEVWME